MPLGFYLLGGYLGEDQCCSVVDFENNLLLWFFGFIKPPVLETSEK
jgi:hypothetical protein